MKKIIIIIISLLSIFLIIGCIKYTNKGILDGKVSKTFNKEIKEICNNNLNLMDKDYNKKIMISDKDLYDTINNQIKAYKLTSTVEERWVCEYVNDLMINYNIIRYCQQSKDKNDVTFDIQETSIKIFEEQRKVLYDGLQTNCFDKKVVSNIDDLLLMQNKLN